MSKGHHNFMNHLNILSALALSAAITGCSDKLDPVVLINRSTQPLTDTYSTALKKSVEYISNTLHIKDSIIIVFQSSNFFISDKHIAYITKKNPNIIYVREDYIGNETLPIILAHEIRHIWQYINLKDIGKQKKYSYKDDPLEIDARAFQLKYGIVAQKIFYRSLNNLPKPYL